MLTAWTPSREDDPHASLCQPGASFCEPNQFC
jgi:hypothetical protein